MSAVQDEALAQALKALEAVTKSKVSEDGAHMAVSHADMTACNYALGWVQTAVASAAIQQKVTA